MVVIRKFFMVKTSKCLVFIENFLKQQRTVTLILPLASTLFFFRSISAHKPTIPKNKEKRSTCKVCALKEIER